MKIVGKTQVSALGLKPRYCNVLVSYGYNTVKQLRQASDRELMSLPHFGRRGVEAIRAVTLPAISIQKRDE